MVTQYYPGEVQYTLRLTSLSEAILVDTIKKYIPTFTGVFPDVHFYMDADSLVSPVKRELWTNICSLMLHDLPYYPEQADAEDAPDSCLQFVLNASRDINEMATWAMLDGATVPDQTLNGMFGAFKQPQSWEHYANSLLKEVSELDLCFQLLDSIDLVQVTQRDEESDPEPICIVEWQNRAWVQSLLQPAKLAEFQPVRVACDVRAASMEGDICVSRVGVRDQEDSKVQALFEANQCTAPARALVFLTEDDRLSLMDYKKQSNLRPDYRENHNLAMWSQPLLTPPTQPRTVLQAIKPVSMVVLLDAEGKPIAPISEQGKRIYDPESVLVTVGYIIVMYQCMIKLDIPEVLGQFKLTSAPIHKYFIK